MRVFGIPVCLLLCCPTTQRSVAEMAVPPFRPAVVEVPAGTEAEAPLLAAPVIAFNSPPAPVAAAATIRQPAPFQCMICGRAAAQGPAILPTAQTSLAATAATAARSPPV